MTFKEEWTEHWPAISAALWRYLRVFVASFTVTFGSMIALIDGKLILGEAASIGFLPFLTALWNLVFYPACLSAIIAGISAAGKLMRDEFPDIKALSKMPI